MGRDVVQALADAKSSTTLPKLVTGQNRGRVGAEQGKEEVNPRGISVYDDPIPFLLLGLTLAVYRDP